MPKKLTDEDLAGRQFKNSMHMNLGSGGYGYGYVSIKWPRIGYLDFTFKGKRAEKEGCTQQRVWTLDGQPVESKQAAMDGHAVAPTLDEQEEKVLAYVPHDWRKWREVAAEIDERLGLPKKDIGTAAACYPTLSTLKAKDFVQTDQVRDENHPQVGGPLDHLCYITMIRRTPADADQS